MRGVHPPRSDSFIEPLTSLRAFAAVYVVVFHYGNSFIVGHAGIPPVVRTFLGNGRLGVAFFFVLSGFILARVYDGRLRTARQLRQYAVARVARVYPVYLLALVWTFLLGGPFISPAGWRWLPQFLCLQAWVPSGPASPDNWNTPAWTLSAEALFYLTFPFVARGLRHFGLGGSLLSLAAIVALVAATGWASIGYERYVLPGAAAYLPLALLRLPEFVYGIILGQLSTRPAPRGRIAGLAAPVLVIVILLALAIRAEIAATLLVVASGLLIWSLAVRPVTWIGQALSCRPLVLIGGASYSLYIVQTPAHETLRDVLGDGTAARIAFYPVLVGLAVLIFVLIEEPAREFIRKGAALKRPTAAHIVDDLRTG